MLETIAASIYDFPQYYDLLFGSDWRAEFQFLEGCFDRYAKRRVKKLFEPACGTGRLLVKFAQAGYRVAGNDLNPKAAAYANERLAKLGFPATVDVGDMADFRLPSPVDAAFNTINTFRHLPSDESAASHLSCIAASLAPGGLYLLGLHLTPRRRPSIDEESWSASRGPLTVNSRMKTVDLNRRRRTERVSMIFDVYTPTRQFRLADEFDFRTWSAEQFATLLRGEPRLKTVATFDFAYDLEAPIDVDDATEDVVFVLRRE